jgi:3-(3-hydroxy-phenyl)propionate hydroxylase
MEEDLRFMDSRRSHYDVLVVGLGPVGGVMAGLLRTHGLSALVIDLQADIYPLPRAGSFDDEAMRVFQMLSLAETLLPLCRVMDAHQFLSRSREILLRLEMPTEIGPNGWTPSYILHQPEVERALRKRIREIGADIRLGTCLTGFTQNADEVVAHVTGPDGPTTITAKYLIGCDGANSQVRKVMGTTEFDYGFSESWLIVDAIISNDEGLPKIATQFCDPAQPTTFLRMTGNRYRWEFMLKPGEDPEAFASDDTLARLLAPWNQGGRIEVERRALYRFRGMVADEWRVGRAFLAGDAAHLMPPFLGQGMCSGFRDAANLAWKIAAVLGGGASDGLLDTYQQEREPHVRGIIERAIELGKLVCTLDPEVAAQRDEQMLAMRAAGLTPPAPPPSPLQNGCLMGGPESGGLFIQPVVNGIRLDDKLGIGACLITVNPATRALGQIKQFSIAAKRSEPLVPPLLGWLEERGVEAVLIRPDRYVFGIGKADDLVDGWQASLRTGAAQTI